MCSCMTGPAKTAAANRYEISYPAGSGRNSKIVYSELAAKIAVQAVAGATWRKL